jgi:hypothetical protein
MCCSSSKGCSAGTTHVNYFVFSMYTKERTGRHRTSNLLLLLLQHLLLELLVLVLLVLLLLMVVLVLVLVLVLDLVVLLLVLVVVLLLLEVFLLLRRPAQRKIKSSESCVDCCAHCFYNFEWR